MVKQSDIDWVWEKAKKVRGKNPNFYRRDEQGNEIYKPAFGTEGDKGWEVDHRLPVSPNYSRLAVKEVVSLD